MATRTFAQVPPTAATIALNAYIYGYGGHSLVTPHQALKLKWWTDERIDARITRAFVISKLRGEEREFLDRPLAFGEGLTDDTYMEWILDRAKRLFLILTQIGVPDQIFGCIDDSWDDDDLPIPLENVKSLELSYDNDENLNKKFYDMQFVYLLRELKEGAHIDYGPKEHIPMEYVNTLPPAVCLQPYDRVHFPNRPDEVFTRRKYSLTDKDTGQPLTETFSRDVKKARALAHEHVAPAWATYSTENSAYVLSDFVPEHTLGTFIDHRTPVQYMKVSPLERSILVCEWLHCLSDALASLHHRGVAHTAIRPSNIWIDTKNRIAFADVGCIGTFQRNKKVTKTEAYDYAAPESQICKTPIVIRNNSPPVSSMNFFNKSRKLSTLSDTSSSTSGSSGASSTRSNSFSNLAVGSPITPPSTTARSSSIGTESIAMSPTLGGARSPRGFRNFSRRLGAPSHKTHIASLSSIRGISTPLLPSQPTVIDPDTLQDLPTATPEMSDVYSLACVFLDVVTFVVRGKTTDFVKYRSSRVAVPSSRTSSKTTYRTDTSFHSEPDKIYAWIELLEEDSHSRTEQIFRGIPNILRLIRSMMSQNATLRPTALQVRDRLQDILVGECSVEALCCAGREWELHKHSSDTNDHDSSMRGSLFRRERDELSIATGMLGPTLHGRKKGSDLFRSGSSFGDGHGQEMDMSILGEVEIDSEKQHRRRSSASTATAKMASWRARFFSNE